jgi:hypothetical protein
MAMIRWRSPNRRNINGLAVAPLRAIGAKMTRLRR